MNGLLFYLLDAYSKEDHDDLSSSDCETYAKLCEKNFCDGVQDYETLVTPTLENIQCLMMGVSMPLINTKSSLTVLEIGHESARRCSAVAVLDLSLHQCSIMPESRIPP